MKNKGFTLIELLVVIAIIGILSAVVLANLNSARNKGKDVSAKSSLSAIRASAEICYNGGTACGTNTYGTAGVGTVTGGVVAGLSGVCSDADVSKLLKGVSAQLPATTVVYCTVGLSGLSYEADATLNDATIFCVDSNSFAGKPSGTPTRAIAGAVKCE